jgi:hypothetical protein
LFGVNGIHRAFMSSLVVVVAFIAFVDDDDDDDNDDDDDVRRRGRSSANDAADVALGTSTKCTPLILGLPCLIDER